MEKLAVFDWNGTLLADTLPSWKAGNACLEYYGAPPISFQRYRETFTFPIIHFYKLNGCDIDTVLARKDEAYRVFHEAYEALAVRCRMRGGARDALNWLKERDIACIILSNHVTDRIETQLQRLGIGHYFQHVSAHEDGTSIIQYTSKSERLSAYMEQQGYLPGDTVIIGDSMEEPDIGRHLGLTSIGITDGYITEKRLRAAKPDFTISAMRELAPLLQKLWKCK